MCLVVILIDMYRLEEFIESCTHTSQMILQSGVYIVQFFIKKF